MQLKFTISVSLTTEADCGDDEEEEQVIAACGPSSEPPVRSVCLELLKSLVEGVTMELESKRGPLHSLAVAAIQDVSPAHLLLAPAPDTYLRKSGF